MFRFFFNTSPAALAGSAFGTATPWLVDQFGMGSFLLVIVARCRVPPAPTQRFSSSEILKKTACLTRRTVNSLFCAESRC